MNPSGKKKKRDLHNKEAQAYIVEICIGSAPFFVFYISFPAFVNTVPYIVKDTLLMYSVIRIMILSMGDYLRLCRWSQSNHMKSYEQRTFPDSGQKDM